MVGGSTTLMVRDKHAMQTELSGEFYCGGEKGEGREKQSIELFVGRGGGKERQRDAERGRGGRRGKRVGRFLPFKGTGYCLAFTQG